AEMARLFRRHPQAIVETLRFAETLDFSLRERRHYYPPEAESDPQSELERLTWHGAQARYPEGIPDRIRDTIVHELGLIGQLRYAPYLLTVHNNVRFARHKGILCQGRGSVANSTICFCLHITEVDPAVHDVLF